MTDETEVPWSDPEHERKWRAMHERFAQVTREIAATMGKADTGMHLVTAAVEPLVLGLGVERAAAYLREMADEIVGAHRDAIERRGKLN